MTLGQYEYAGKMWVLTDRPFRPDDDGKLTTGLRIPGIAREDMAPGIVFSLTEADLDRIDFAQWIAKGRVLPYVEGVAPEIVEPDVLDDLDDEELYAFEVVEDDD